MNSEACTNRLASGLPGWGETDFFPDGKKREAKRERFRSAACRGRHQAAPGESWHQVEANEGIDAGPAGNGGAAPHASPDADGAAFPALGNALDQDSPAAPAAVLGTILGSVFKAGAA